MGGKAFTDFDVGTRKLHESWTSVFRLFLLVSLLAIHTWAFVRILAYAVHAALHQIFDVGTDTDLLTWASLLGLLAMGGLVRGVLIQHPK